MRIVLTVLSAMAVQVLFAGNADTLSVSEKKSERNMMLNAESATAPREINIGLPESGQGLSYMLME